MSLLKLSKFAPVVGRQALRLSSVSSQQRRGYADMAFTFASPGGVSDERDHIIGAFIIAPYAAGVLWIYQLMTTRHLLPITQNDETTQ